MILNSTRATYWKILPLALTILLSAGCTKSLTPAEKANAVHIDKKELSVERGSFVEPKNRLSAHALTEWMFHCYPSFTFEKQVSAGYPRMKVAITITKIALLISCPVAMRAGANSNQDTLEHEDGHLSIVKRVYDHADAEARKTCEQMIGQRFEGEGENEDEAINAATDKASRRLCNSYTARTVAFVNEVSEEFDRATEHGRNGKPVPQAVSEAWDKFKKAHPAEAKLAP